MRRRALLLVVVAAFAMPAAADYAQAYRSGVTAYDKKAFKDAVAAMQQAISERPTESAKTVQIYGMRFEPYTPHYYLGMSLANLGRCTEATQALKETQRQKVISGKYAAEVEQALARCAPIEPPTETTKTETRSPEPEKPLPPTNTETTATAPKRDERLEPARRSLENQLGRARRLLRSVPKNASPREASTVTGRIRAAEAASVSLSADEILEASQELAVASGDLETWLNTPRDTPPPPPQRSAEPPRELVAAVDAYLRGDYQASLDALTSAKFADPRIRAQALLFRAAALHALYVIGHSSNADMYARALADARGYKSLQKDAPDRRVFSPDFVLFVQEERSPDRARQIGER